MPKVKRSLDLIVNSKLEIRKETLFGKDYIAIPLIAMVEGVRLGANQENPELGLASEFGDPPSIWANRPVVLNHPQVKGIPVTANSPETLEDYAFGFTMNPEVDDLKLKMEAWIDVERVQTLGGEFSELVESIVNQETAEVSVGFFSSLEKTKGTYDGESFEGIWRNIKPDHLAILSKGTLGACSNKDGCGIPRINQRQEGFEMFKLKQQDKVKPQLENPLLKIDSSCSCNSDEDGKCNCQTEDAKVVELTEQRINERKEARQDLKVLEFSDEPLSSDIQKMLQLKVKEKFPNRDAWIMGHNSQYAIIDMWDSSVGSYRQYKLDYELNDGSVEFVGEPEEVMLITKVVNTSETKEKEMSEKEVNTPEVESQEDDTKTQVVEQAAAPTEPTTPVVQNETPKVVTAEEYINAAPPEIRQVLQAGMELQTQKRNAAIKTLKDSGRCQFSDQALASFDLNTLESMVNLLPPSFEGQSGSVSKPVALQSQESFAPVVDPFAKQSAA